MNLASDVPPVVENLGVILVIFLIIFFAIWIVSLGLVRNDSPLTWKSTLNLHLFFLLILLTTELIFFFRLIEVCRLLNLTLNWALAEAGITLVALLSTFIEVNSKLEGWKFLLPWSSFFYLSFLHTATNVLIGLFTKWG